MRLKPTLSVFPTIRQLQLDFVANRSSKILDEGFSDYLPQEYLEDLVTNDEAPDIYTATGFLYKYYDQEFAALIIEGLYHNFYQ